MVSNGLGAWIQKRTFAKFFKRLLKLLLCVHYNWPIPRHRLLEWLTRYKQEPKAIVSRLNDNFVTAIEEHKGTVVSLRQRRSMFENIPLVSPKRNPMVGNQVG